MAIATGSKAPEAAAATREGPHVLAFFKVTCRTTQLATPAIERLGQAFPGRVIGVGQDPQPALDAFSTEYGLTLPLVPDLDPYEASDAYGIESAPTAVAVAGDGGVRAVAWGRAGAPPAPPSRGPAMPGTGSPRGWPTPSVPRRRSCPTRTTACRTSNP